MSRCTLAFVVFAFFLLGGQTSAGEFQGKLFDLDGKPIVKEKITINVFILDGNNQPGNLLFAGDFDKGDFAFLIDPKQVANAPTKAIRILFFRNGFNTRTTDGLLANSTRTQILDVTVPELPPCQILYWHHASPRRCRLR